MADTATWNGGVGDWSSANLWSGGVVPNNYGSTSFDVMIDNRSALDSSVTLNAILPNYIISSLTISGGDTLTMQPSSDLAVSAITNAGTIKIGDSGLLRLSNGASLKGAGSLTLTGGAVTVPSGGLWSNVDNVISGYGTINNFTRNQANVGSNVASHLLTISAVGISPDSGTLTNTGTLSATNRGTLSISAINLANSGQIVANGGTINLTISGSINNGINGQLVLQSGGLAFYRAFTLNRDDEVQAIGGQLTFAQSLTTIGHTLTAPAGVSANFATLNNNGGTVNLSGTTSFGATTNVGGQILLHSSTQSMAVASATIDNTGGTFSISNNGAFTLQNNAILTGGTFTSSSGGALTVTGQYNYNGGTIKDLKNTGTININDNGNVAGTIVNNGAMNFGPGYQNFAVGTVTLSGSGTANLAYCNADAAYTAGGGSVTFVNDTSHSISGYGNFAYTAGGTPKTVINRGLLQSTPAGTGFASLNAGGNHFVNESTGTLRALTNSNLYIRTSDFTSLGTIDVLPGAIFTVLSESGGTASIGSISNAGTVILQQNAGTLGSINGGTLSVRNFGTFTIGQMNVDFFSNNGTVNIAAGSTAAAKTKGFSMTELNVNDRAFLVDYDGASPLASLTAKLKKGYDASAGRWKGAVSAIFSDSAAADPSHRSIGIAEVSTLFSASLPATFLGQIVDATTVAIRYTYAGDATLDGVVNVVDLGLLASHWQQSGVWSGGDFNYDGKIDVIDLGILASDWQLGAAGPGVGFADALASAGLAGASVPEPAIALLAPLLLLRRRQRPAYCCS